MKTARKASIILIAFIFTAATNFAVAQDAPFPDVNSSHTNWKAISFMYQNDVFTGYPDGTFQPEKVLNRAEQLKVYMLLHGISPDAPTYNNCFPDVADEWFARYVCYAYENGIVEGYPDGLFRPAQEVNKVEALKMLAELQGWEAMEPETAPYSDVPTGEWFTKYVYFAMEHYLLSETGDTFGPAEGISRAGTAELMFRSLAVYKLNKPYDSSLNAEIEAISLTDLSSLPETENNENQAQAVITIESISPENGTVQVGSFYDISFSMKDASGDPLTSATPEVYFWQPYIATEEDGSLPIQFFTPHSQGNGIYEVQVSSTIKGANTLVIHDPETGATQKESIAFLPGAPFELSVEETYGNNENSVGVLQYDVALLDQYKNIIPNAKFAASAGFGELSVDAQYNGMAEVTFAADGFGETTIDFSGEINGSTRDANISVDVLPFALGGEPGYEVTDATTEVPVLFFIPDVGTSTSSYQMQLEVPAELPFIGFSPSPQWADLIQIDQVVAENGNYLLTLDGSDIPGGNFFNGKIGDLVFESFPEGEIEFDGGITLESEDPSYPEILYKGGTTKVKAGEKSVYVPVYSRPFAAIKGKTQKTICIDAFIEPGIGVTIDDVKADAKQAEDIFYKNAKSCNCPHFLKVDVSGITFSKAQWDTFTGKDGLDAYDVTNMVDKGTPVKPRRACTPVIYSNDIDHAGQSNRNSTSDELSSNGKMGASIFVNNAKDSDGTTLAHELAHHLSGNAVKDPDGGRHQGAGAKGNLMSYDEADENGKLKEKVAGDDLTKTQCDLINFDHWRFSVYPPK